MKKASALTAALSGAPAPAAAEAGKAAKPANKVDATSFPCLAYAREGAKGGVAEALAGLQLDVSSVVIVGSAPTRVEANGVTLADYPIPHRRRAGKEDVLSPAMSTRLSSGDFGSLRPGSLRPGSLRPGSLMPGSSFSSNFLSDAVIGSLPKAMSATERRSVMQSMPMSPALNMLSTMPADKVMERSLEGQRMRRSALKGAVIGFVTAGYSGKRFIFEKARELGVRAVVLDGPDSWVQLLEPQGVIEKFVPIDFSDAETVFERCLTALKQASKALGGLDGVCTFCEMAVPLAARLAEQLGLATNSSESVDHARDKHKTRQLMEAAGLPTPRNMLVEKTADVEAAAAHVGFPCVIKPISGAASIGVIRANTVEELRAAYARVQGDLKRCRIVAGALVEGEEGGEEDGNAGSWINLQTMVEEYLDGDEVDCDLIFSDGVCVYGAITDNWPTVEPYFNETGSNCPSTLPPPAQEELLQLSVRAVQSLGLTMGVFHVECKQTSRGARLIEVNCRMGGGPVRDTNLLVWGVDLVEEHIALAAGIPARPLIARRPLLELAEYSINAKVSGTMEHVNFLDAWQSHPDVMYARPLVAAGDRCVCVEDGLPTWVCEIMVRKPRVQEAIDFIKEIEQSLTIPIH